MPLALETLVVDEVFVALEHRVPRFRVREILEAERASAASIVRRAHAEGLHLTVLASALSTPNASGIVLDPSFRKASASAT